MSRDGQKSTASTPLSTVDITPVSNSNSRPGLGPTVQSPSNPHTTKRNDQNASSSISENNLNRRVKDGSAPLPSLLGISQAHPHTQYSGGRSFNYEEKYAPDPLGEELNENARVFKVYLDETESFDDDMLRGFRETIDSLLVFAALFSAVVTSFIIATIASLQPDYSQISAVLLMEQVQLLRAAGNSTAINAIPQPSIDLQNASVDANTLWINGLFLTSLSLALVTALLSVLVKQWLQAYTSILAGNAKQRAMIRQFRYHGLVKWKVPEIIGVLPIILHMSLALFLIGLTLYISVLHSSLCWILVTITSLAFTFYFGSIFIPQFKLECPYRIPLLFAPIKHGIHAFTALMWILGWVVAKTLGNIDDFKHRYGHTPLSSLSQTANLRDYELLHLRHGAQGIL
ncbi:hypothetical protein C8R41DRAFT_879375, partial [Lentinula lateritia]